MAQRELRWPRLAPGACYSPQPPRVQVAATLVGSCRKAHVSGGNVASIGKEDGGRRLAYPLPLMTAADKPYNYFRHDRRGFTEHPR